MPVIHPELCLPDVSLFVDASTTGYGAVLVSSEEMPLVFEGKWDRILQAKEINEAEAEAIFRAAKYFTTQLHNANGINVFVDNTSAQYSLKKGYARAFELND